ncbi:MAG TPA: thiamine diphosphokinase [Clostridiaceae bacterium]
MKVIIISNGEPPLESMLKDELVNSSLLICADGGANCLYKYGIIPDILIGDFDSIREDILSYYEKKGCALIKHPVNKDFTDTELALETAKELGAKEIVFLGATGNRLDHTLGNISLLLSCLNSGLKAFIIDNKNKIIAVNKSTEIFGEPGDLFSLIPYGEEVTGLTLSGCEYILNKYNLKLGSTITLSNTFIDKKVKINFEKGLLLILFCSD